MKADRILFIDTETGGTDPANNSLLSLGLVVWKASEIGASLEILIDDGVLNVTEKALGINRINLQEHRKKAVSPRCRNKADVQIRQQSFSSRRKDCFRRPQYQF
ncbi:hypothetical protein ACQ86N_37190 [Puia sp. P3]|uniref:hypothetical protein n=1 Tax=Puia sp. P3 TaxID=3423952 RepID=UPI003D66720B